VSLLNTVIFVNTGVRIIWYERGGRTMQTSARARGEWIDGFLFVGNKPILDFLNTKPVISEQPTELLPSFHAFERWFLASDMSDSAKGRRLPKEWRSQPDANRFLQELIKFRERFREAVLRMEKGAMPSEDLLKEVNAGLRLHQPVRELSKKGKQIVRSAVFDLQQPGDLWGPILDATADFLSEVDTHRLRQCEACVIHFLDTSKKGSRRWCCMNLWVQYESVRQQAEGSRLSAAPTR
jgi:predicted RNA-binding Zn ribbon-like protein